VLVQHTSLGDTISAAERNGVGEIKIASGFDQGEIHAGLRKVGNDTLNLRYGKVAARVGHFARLVIDDPVPDARLDTTQILTRKLISLSGAVIVDRIRAVDEDPESHELLYSALFFEIHPPYLLTERSAP
jgi:hypothetical protein